ncbi:hypothetical protein RND71_020271 [Anisodus tanguticus]|uniref:C2 domain-containing protein n=1 Tax=Anisodus tanguticus TaxID=243964 RepID=A0AAE1RYV9_9SOLA|nr:hypothetical protein RND71_020271 [Anisodus tanguticus]
MPESHIRRKQEERLREIEVLIYSAVDLKNVKHLTKMRTYAEVYVERDVHVAKTKVAEHHDGDDGTNPIWNQVVKVKFHEKLPENNIMAALNVDIYAHGHLREKPVGSARVLLSDVLKGGGDTSELLLENNPIQFLAVQVWRPSGRPQGLIHLWIPPTGRFLVPLKSLSFSLRGRDGEEEVVMVETAAENGEGGGKE